MTNDGEERDGRGRKEVVDGTPVMLIGGSQSLVRTLEAVHSDLHTSTFFRRQLIFGSRCRANLGWVRLASQSERCSQGIRWIPGVQWPWRREGVHKGCTWPREGC